MQIALQQQQTARNYVLAKIDRTYTDRKVAEAKKKLQAARKRRRQLASAKTAFQQELDKAISLKTQEGLGIKVIPDLRLLPQPQFVARFEFLGKRWLITCKKSLWGCQWYFCMEGQSVSTRCTAKDLEDRLYYALGKYKNSFGHKVRFLTLLPASHESSRYE
jgi:hypothetical protein